MDWGKPELESEIVTEASTFLGNLFRGRGTFLATSAGRVARAGVLIAGLAGNLLVVSSAMAQDREPCPVAVPGALVLYGDVDAPITLDRARLAALPQVTVRGTPHGGEPGTYTGPTLQAILAHADVPSGPELRGREMLRYVVVEAVDGYRALFALAETDSAFHTPTPILALTRDGQTLDADALPFQIVVPDEQRHARWVRQVACLRLAHDG